MSSYSESKGSSILILCMFLCLFSSTWMLHHIRQVHGQFGKEEALYVSSPTAVKRLSLGYTGLMADIYWTRAVQYFGWLHKQRADNYDLLYPLLDISTYLDPHLIVAYRFGSNFLAPAPPNGAGQPEKAVSLIERGIEANPNEWRLYYEMGFVQAMELHDYVTAARSFQRGSALPNAHPFLKVLAAAMAQHGGDQETARLMWNTTLASSDDPMIRSNATRHLAALRADADITRLEQIIARYREQTGAFPANFLQLVSKGLLRSIPLDPLGHPYKLLAEGRIEVQDPDGLPFISKGLPPGWKPRLQTVTTVKM